MLSGSLSLALTSTVTGALIAVLALSSLATGGSFTAARFSVRRLGAGSNSWGEPESRTLKSMLATALPLALSAGT